jgi:nitrate/nitrite transport system permease protein
VTITSNDLLDDSPVAAADTATLETSTTHPALDTAVPPYATVQSSRRLARTSASLGWALVGFGVFITLWQLAAVASADVPTPIETFKELGHLLSDPFRNGGPNDKGVAILLKNSLGRVLGGFLIAVIVGVPLGLAAGSSKRVWQATNPVIQLLRPVSPLAWFPIILIALKDASMAGVWVIFITAVWPIVLNAATGAASVPSDQRNVAKVFKLGRLAYLRHVLIPHSLPNVITGMRLSMGTGWMVIVAVEMLSSQVGIGGYAWETYNSLNLARVAAIVLIIGFVGLLLDIGFMRLHRALTKETL